MFIKYIYKYILSALERLADGLVLPPSPSNHTPHSLTPPLHASYIYDRQAEQRYTSTFTKRLTSWEKSASSPDEVKIHTHVTELSFDTVLTEDSGKGKYHFYCHSDNMSIILCLVYCDILYCTVLCCVLGTVYLIYLYCIT